MAVASHVSKDTPGLVLHKRMRVGAGSLASISYEFDNQGAQPLRLQLSEWLWGGQDRARITLPLRGGPVRGNWAEFPHDADEAFKRTNSYAERWAAAEDRGSGRTLSLTSPVPLVTLAAFNQAGGHLKLLPDITVPPHGSAELVAYLAVSDTLEEARRYSCLRDL